MKRFNGANRQRPAAAAAWARERARGQARERAQAPEAAQKRHRITAPQLVFAVLTALMMVVFLASFGSPLQSPWPLALNLEGQTIASASGNTVALVDKQESRLALVDANEQVVSITEVDPNAVNGENFSAVCATGELVYYATATDDSASAYLSSEQVYAMNAAGGSSTLVYQQSYAAEQSVASPTVLALVAADADVLLLRLSTDGAALELVSLVAQPGERLASQPLPAGAGFVNGAAYDTAAGSLAFVDNLGELYVARAGGEFTKLAVSETAAFVDCAWGGDGALYCLDALASGLVRVDACTGALQGCLAETRLTSVSSASDGSMLLCSTGDSCLVFRVADFAESTEPLPAASLASVSFAPAFAAGVVITWVALAYLVVCAAVALLRLAMGLHRKGRDNQLIKAAFIAGCALLLIGVSLFYSKQFYDFSENERHDTVESLCQVGVGRVEKLADAQQAEGAGTAAAAAADGSTLEGFAQNVGETLYEQCGAFADNNMGVSFICAFWPRGTTFILGADSSGYGFKNVLGDGSQADELRLREYAQAAQGTVQRAYWSGARENYLVAYRAIADTSGETIGVVIASCRVSDLVSSYTSLCINLAMTLLAALGAVLLILLEGKGLLEAWRLKRAEKKLRDGRPEIWDTRLLLFFVLMAGSFDSAMSVLVAQEMLDALGLFGVEALVGLPVTAFTLGGVFGNLLFGILSGRVNGRSLFVAGSLFGSVFLLLSFCAVQANAFWLFCALKFCTGIALYTCTSLLYALPLRTSDEKKRGKLFQDATMTALSSGALGGLACGYVAQYLGNGFIYLANAAPALVAFALGWRLLPGRMFFGAQKPADAGKGSNAAARKSLLALFFSPAVLALTLCVTFPELLAAGYKSIFFPLFMADGGLTKTYINNIAVLGNIVIFVVSPYVTRALKDADPWLVVIAALLFAGAVLAWFAVNATAAWAVLALVLLGLATKICAPARKVLLPREARARGVSEARANNIDGILSSLLCSARSTVLSALTALGQSSACVVLAVVCGAGAGLFALSTAHAPIRGKDQQK